MGGGLKTKKRKKAFTLIELLAIIVILAIIAVITVPIILNIIENSRKGAATDSAYGYKDAVNKYYVTELSDNNNLKLEGEYTVSNGSLTGKFEGSTSEQKTVPISVSGDKPSSGKLRYANNVLNAGCLVIGDYKISFGTDGKVNGTVKGDCEDYEFPIIGSQTSNNPYLTRFDGNYTYKDVYNEEYDELDDEWITYLRNDGTKNEVCGVFENGTVCLTSSYYNSNYSLVGNYESDFEDVDADDSYTALNIDSSGLKGYTKAKVDEMLTNGATSCEVGTSTDPFRVKCGNITIYADGFVDSYDGSADIYCNVSENGSAYCG